MQHSDVRLGQEVLCEGRPGVWKVIKINPVNIKLQHTERPGRLNAHPSFLRPYDGSGSTYVAPTVQPIEHFDQEFTLGTIIAFTDAALVNRYPGFWVVLSIKNNNVARIAKLGGNGGRYVRGIRPSHQFIIIDAEALLHPLQEKNDRV